MLRSKWFWIIVILIVIGVAWYMKNKNAPVEPLERYTVTRGDVIETVNVSGQVVPVDSAELSFEAIGTVEWVGIDVGDRVKKGQELVRLDRNSLWTQYRAAQEDVRKAVAEEQLQRRHWDDLKPEQREQFKSSVSQARARLATINVALGKTTLTAPMDGIVTLQKTQAGERVKEVGTIIRIISDDAFEIESLVSESDILQFQLGKSGIATFDAWPSDEELRVRVTTIEPEATVVQDVVYYKVVFTAPALAASAAQKLKSGMSADIDLVMAERDDVVTVPRRMVGQDAEGFFVMIERGTGETRVTERVAVELGVQGDDGTVEITNGLTTGDIIVIEE